MCCPLLHMALCLHGCPFYLMLKAFISETVSNRVRLRLLGWQWCALNGPFILLDGWGQSRERDSKSGRGHSLQIISDHRSQPFLLLFCFSFMIRVLYCSSPFQRSHGSGLLSYPPTDLKKVPRESFLTSFMTLRKLFIAHPPYCYCSLT